MPFWRKTVEVTPQAVKDQLVELTHEKQRLENRVEVLEMAFSKGRLAWIDDQEIIVTQRFSDLIGDLPEIKGFILSRDPSIMALRYVPVHLDRQRALKIAAEEIGEAAEYD